MYFNSIDYDLGSGFMTNCKVSEEIVHFWTWGLNQRKPSATGEKITAGQAQTRLPTVLTVLSGAILYKSIPQPFMLIRVT